MDITLTKAVISGTAEVPPSKSHSIRALFISAFSGSVCKIFNLLESADTLACIEVCKALGVRIFREENCTVVDGTKLISDGNVNLDCSNSGTTLFFATALCSLLNIQAHFSGDKSLSKRSALNLINSLRDLGAVVTSNGFLPYTVCGTLTGGTTEIDCPTSQFLSALLLACPLAKNNSFIKVKSLNEKPYVDMTLYWLDKQKIKYEYKHNTYLIYGNQRYKEFTETINSDYSSASFFFAAAAITGGSVTVSNLKKDSTQADMAVLDILEKAGCCVGRKDNAVTVYGTEKLRGFDIDLNTMPDSLPVLSVLFCFADRPVRLYNVAQARLKETDRIKLMTKLLNSIGAQAEETEDGMYIKPIKSFSGGIADSHNDHRIAMALAVASLKCSSYLTIRNAECVNISFPDFFERFSGVTCENCSGSSK